MRACLLLALVACSACTSAARADDDRRTDESVRIGKQAFGTVYQVLLDPRCMNCHPIGDAPLQFDNSQPHGAKISRRSEQNGLACSTCHRTKNNPRPNQPPGAPNWKLPPVEHPMVFQGRRPKELCEQLKDPKETGGKDLAAVLHHVEHDALVKWGWDPGPGRKPVKVPRETFLKAMKTWVDAGGPCPD